MNNIEDIKFTSELDVNRIKYFYKYWLNDIDYKKIDNDSKIKDEGENIYKFFEIYIINKTTNFDKLYEEIIAFSKSKLNYK